MATKKQSERGRAGRRRLGRGLSSLLSGPVEIDAAAPDLADASQKPTATATIEPKQPPRRRETAEARQMPSEQPSPGREGVPDSSIHMLPIGAVAPRADQPRQQFDEQALARLAASIRAAGLMQPILVRPAEQGGYEIIAGERRWRAARSIGLDSIPAIIRDLDNEACAEWSLIENLQREDLNPIERAEAFRRLIDEFQLSHLELADRVGLDRSSVTNHLRLIELDDECKAAVREGRLSMGHAKALLSLANLSDRTRVSRQAMRSQWSVRRLEQACRSLAGSTAPADGTPSAPTAPANAHIEDLQRRLGEHVGTKVRIVPGRKKGAGKLIIEFFNFDHFESIMQTLQFPLDA